MTGTKPWYKSRGVWGAIVTLAVAVGAGGIDVSELDQAEAVDLLMVGGGAVGGLLALVGRIRARDTLTRSFLPLAFVLTTGALLSACALPAVTNTYDQLTGTTLEQRCAGRTLAIERLRARPDAEGERIKRLIDEYEFFVKTFCPPPWGVAPPAVPPNASPAPGPAAMASFEPRLDRMPEWYRTIRCQSCYATCGTRMQSPRHQKTTGAVGGPLVEGGRQTA